MTNRPDSNALHDRAASSAKETRSTIITLSTAAIGGLFFVATGKIEPSLTHLEKLIVLATILGMVGALGSAIWFGFCDAQWSYWWGVELDDTRDQNGNAKAKKSKDTWHTWKNRSERAMLVLFVLGAISGGSFVVARTLFAPIASSPPVKVSFESQEAFTNSGYNLLNSRCHEEKPNFRLKSERAPRASC